MPVSALLIAVTMLSKVSPPAPILMTVSIGALTALTPATKLLAVWSELLSLNVGAETTPSVL